MDDFLHNLRSGKLKQHDRGRSYNDPQYKGGQRRNTHQDRRKKELEAFERLNAVKEVLEAISGTQARMAEAYEARTLAEERKARAMEVLAKNIYRMLNPDADDADELFDPEPVLQAVAEPMAELMSESVSQSDNDIAPAEHDMAEHDMDDEAASNGDAKKLSESDRQTLYKIITKMRNDGDKWEQIARHIASKGYSTVSGKGTWRGAMAKNLFEKMDAQ